MTSSWEPQWTRERAHPLMRERGAHEATNFWGPQAEGLGTLRAEDPVGISGRITY
jgi:hypothetical protein